VRALWLVGLLSLPALAQEIGTETAPPPAPPPPAGMAPSELSTPPSMVANPAMSAGRLSFGLRGGFGGVVMPVAPARTTDPASMVPSLSATFFLTDMLALALDLGLGLGILPNQVAFGFSVGAGAWLYLRDTQAQVRPFVGGMVSFGKLYSTSGEDFTLAAQVGGGLAYFFSPKFSVDVRALIGVPFGFSNLGVTVQFFTVSPGIGATVFL
jgi:hypothetical protein